MLQKVEKLLNRLESDLNQIKAEIHDPEECAQQSLETVIEYLDEVNELTANHPFESVSDEIKFFKYCKPKLVARYFYFYRLVEYEIQKAKIDQPRLRKYFKKEKKRILRFFEKHVDLVASYKSTDPTADQNFFTRKSCCDSACCKKVFLVLSNPKQSKNDLILAEIMANEQLYIYIEKELNKLKPIDEQNHLISPFHWTGSKVALVELIYALASTKMVDNGDVEIKDLVRLFEQVFQQKIDSPYQVFSEIKARKHDQTKFLDQLKDALVQRISEE
jgi:ElaB/YqjD/DUF883 family membrane-anchored ribosome-binding protein